MTPEHHLYRTLAQYFLKHTGWIPEKTIMEDLRSLYTKRLEKGFEPSISTNEDYGDRIPEVRRILKHWYAIGAIDARGDRQGGFRLKASSEGYLKEVIRGIDAENRRDTRRARRV